MFKTILKAIRSLWPKPSKKRSYIRHTAARSGAHAVSMAQQMLRTGALTATRDTGCPLLRDYK